jgi:hypothetical protein
VNVTVTNTDTSTATLTNGYTYVQQNFDPNGDSTIDPSDIFYLINYLFLGGPAPAGTAGPVLSGDANGDGVVDPSDIFYLVFYLFGVGPAPHAEVPGGVATTLASEPISGQVSLGRATLRNGRWFVPVTITLDEGSAMPQALSLRVRTASAQNVSVRRASGVDSIFEVSRTADDSISYLLAFGERTPLAGKSANVAEIEVPNGEVQLTIDRELTMLVDASGTRKATVASGTLRVSDASTERAPATPRSPRSNRQ